MSKVDKESPAVKSKIQDPRSSSDDIRSIFSNLSYGPAPEADNVAQVEFPLSIFPVGMQNFSLGDVGRRKLKAGLRWLQAAFILAMMAVQNWLQLWGYGVRLIN